MHRADVTQDVARERQVYAGTRPSCFPMHSEPCGYQVGAPPPVFALADFSGAARQ
ncbi:MAG: hypothetical protein WAT39_01905 [Planctomycetota bacterium]